ncbi:(S)-1-Phenylethanol dehydrogenase [Mycobacterium pseudokansasii]|uniref:(S)-1-Phenylethanol dehydrogenase n=1 Tax=Mycobacterium pseudokansasii TaxID=2341080 RepID=A0A498QS53_9MYCO|nr:(S)-1-Phenylethanol dehydrogenase [Mycobacterium pseudokansasii]VAZ97431.1 (S)-1-Phenylethanol dehydrogenase [Mycobacterium pseudokansasii]VBA51491.1 (S)-1-Phenylethanol dehydrogenase [Mycobacterium pseudokansasii]
MAAELGADYFVADFADLWQVRALADKIRSQYPRIDVLVNNAGGMTNKPYLTADGYEITYQVNYLAPFLLTTQLLDLLVESRASVINTSSGAHKWVRNIAIADFENTLRRRPIVAYAISKLANILFTRELHRRYHPDGLSVAAVHPGVVATNFSRASGSQVFALLEKLSLPRLFATAEQGAAPLAWLASSTPGIDWQPGEYYAKSEIAKASRTACDRHLASDLWDRTLATIGHL